MIRSVLHYFNLVDEVVSSSITRHGGASKGKLATLNINPHQGDEPSAVDENLQTVAAEIGIQADKTTRLYQVHGTHCLTVTDAFSRLSVVGQYEMEERKDAVAAGCRNVCIGVYTADCVPVLFYDPVHHVIDTAHAGWRGTVQRIAQHTFRKMTELYGTDSKELKVAVGPCILLKNFEIGQEVYDASSAAGFPMERIACMYKKWHINLPLCN